MPKVWNKRDPSCPKDAIYVGRPSKWGNPFTIGKDGTREEVLQKYRDHIDNLRHTSDLFIFDLYNEITGKDLVCWCAPKPCHADVLLEIANQRLLTYDT